MILAATVYSLNLQQVTVKGATREGTPNVSPLQPDLDVVSAMNAALKADGIKVISGSLASLETFIAATAAREAFLNDQPRSLAGRWRPTISCRTAAASPG